MSAPEPRDRPRAGDVCSPRVRVSAGLWLALFVAVPLSLLVAALSGGPQRLDTPSGEAPPAAPFEARIERIASGDTLGVTAGGRALRVRVLGIDAPERGQDFDEAAREHLATVLGGAARVEPVATDRYGQIVARVLAPDPGVPCVTDDCAKTVDVALAQLRAGMAWHVVEDLVPVAPARAAAHADAKTRARAERRGLWAAERPQPPWEWRRHRSPSRR